MRQSSILVFLLLIALCVTAQTSVPILDRRVTIKVVNQTLGKTLNIISETANFNFSYNSSVLKASKIVSIMAEHRTVKEVLDQLFHNDITYQQIGNHLVLQKKPMAKQSSNIQGNNNQAVKYNYIITGYIRDLYSGDGITQVSIYEKQTLSGTLSGDFGYYKLAVQSRSPEISLKFSRQDYRDTLIKVKFQNSGLADCHINLLSTKPVMAELMIDSPELQLSVKADTLLAADTAKPVLVWQDSAEKKKLRVEDTKAGKWVISAFQKMNERNIRDTFERDWQVTFFPPIGSNGNFSGLVKNRLSFNLIAGYNGGLDGAEFGGLLNVLKKDMRGAQFSGFGNVVGGNINGAQFAGFFNHNIGTVNALQAAGFYNYNHSDANGLQLGGFMNINRGSMTGAQGAGFMNIAESISGVQGAGFMNVAGSGSNVVQAAGFMNISDQMLGTQVAGFMNLAGGESTLIQAAGFMNVADEIIGGQVAGFMNIARKVNGFQLGIFNVADTVNGFVLGLFNFVGNGLHQVELSYNESKQFGLAYRSGMRQFYSIASINSQKEDKDSGTLISYGFGVGNNIRLGKMLNLCTDITSHHMTVDFNSNFLNLHNKLSTGLELQLIKGFCLFGSVSLNHMINDTNDWKYETRFKNFGGDEIWSHGGRYAQKAWLGYQAGIRLF